jgi:glyoxylase-like metal-dependent hydrolase (beta-lactamase superfamily II)
LRIEQLDTHHFSVGKIKLLVMVDGFEYVGEDVVNDMVKPISEAFLQAFHALPQPYPFCYNVLYLESGGERILIDTGLGAVGKPDSGHLLDLLQKQAITADQIDKAILSHLHLDHVGGLTVDEKPVFTNAEIILPKLEWEYWIESEKASAERTQILKAVFQPYLGRIRYVDDGDTVAKGIMVVALPGHTPGHCGFLVESQGEQLLHMVDALHVQTQVAFPEVSAAFDVQPDVSDQSRRMVLERIADAGMMALTYHLPSLGLGRVERDGAGFIWKPVK